MRNDLNTVLSLRWVWNAQKCDTRARVSRRSSSNKSKFRGLWSISFALRVLSWTQILGGQILWSLWTDFVAERCAELPVAVVIAPVGEVLRTVRTSKRSLSGVDALVSLWENIVIHFYWNWPSKDICILTSQMCLWVKSFPQYLQVCRPLPRWMLRCCLMLYIVV